MPLLCDISRACTPFEGYNEFEGIGAGLRSEMTLAWGTVGTFVLFMTWVCVCFEFGSEVVHGRCIYTARDANLVLSHGSLSTNSARGSLRLGLTQP